MRRANHTNNLSDDFSVGLISKTFGPYEIAGVGVDDDQVIFERAACENMRPVAPREEIERLVPERLSQKGWRCSPFAIHDDKESSGESRMQRCRLSAGPKNVVKRKLGEPQKIGK
jgi:hypothetical protein